MDYNMMRMNLFTPSEDAPIEKRAIQMMESVGYNMIVRDTYFKDIARAREQYGGESERFKEIEERRRKDIEVSNNSIERNMWGVINLLAPRQPVVMAVPPQGNLKMAEEA